MNETPAGSRPIRPRAAIGASVMIAGAVLAEQQRQLQNLKAAGQTLDRLSPISHRTGHTKQAPKLVAAKRRRRRAMQKQSRRRNRR